MQLRIKMKGERIKSVLVPKSDDSWIIIQTDKQSYFLKLGGVTNADQFDLTEYDNTYLPIINKIIAEAYTDDFLILIETLDGDGLKHSPYYSIDSEGRTFYGIEYLSRESCQNIKEDFGSKLVKLQ